MDHVTAKELDGFDDRSEFRRMFYDDLVGCGRFDEDVDRFGRRLATLAEKEAAQEASRVSDQFLSTLKSIENRLAALQQGHDEARVLEEEHNLVLELYVVLKLGPIVKEYCNGALQDYSPTTAGSEG